MALALICGVSASWADSQNNGAIAGTDLKHFTQIDTYVFAGSKPISEADYKFLHSKGIKYILQANFLPWLSGSERKKAARFGMEFMTVPMNASVIAPRQKHVDEILRIMRTRQPIYIHCVLGRDRTSLLGGLYRIYFEGFSKEKAYRLMKQEGFRQVFFLHGLKAYFDKHTAAPPQLADLIH